MTTGVVETKGTKLYIGMSATEIHKLACPTGISGLGGAGSQIDITCLDSIEMEYRRGMLNPGQLSIPINFIPKSASHQAILDLRESGETVSFMIVLSDQSGAPSALDSNAHLVSPGATTVEFLGYVADFQLDVTINEIVRGTLTVQRSGELNWTLPTATQP